MKFASQPYTALESYRKSNKMKRSLGTKNPIHISGPRVSDVHLNELQSSYQLRCHHMPLWTCYLFGTFPKLKNETCTMFKLSEDWKIRCPLSALQTRVTQHSALFAQACRTCDSASQSLPTRGLETSGFATCLGPQKEWCVKKPLMGCHLPQLVVQEC